MADPARLLGRRRSSGGNRTELAALADAEQANANGTKPTRSQEEAQGMNLRRDSLWPSRGARRPWRRGRRADRMSRGWATRCERPLQAEAAKPADYGRNVDDADGARSQGRGDEPCEHAGERPAWPPGPGDADGWRAIPPNAPDLEPAVRRGADGLAHRVDRLRLCGNGVVPLVAAHALRTLAAELAGRWMRRRA